MPAITNQPKADSRHVRTATVVRNEALEVFSPRGHVTPPANVIVLQDYEPAGAPHRYGGSFDIGAGAVPLAPGAMTDSSATTSGAGDAGPARYASTVPPSLVPAALMGGTTTGGSPNITLILTFASSSIL
ncbi:hypothetical protein EON62_05960, partial [archaeon]